MWLSLFFGGLFLWIAPITFLVRHVCIRKSKKHHYSIVTKLKKAYNFHDDIEIIETKFANHNIALAHGSWLFSNHYAILVMPGFHTLNNNELIEFFFAHEISHLKHNDFTWMFLYAGIYGLCVTFVIGHLFPWTHTLFPWYTLVISLLCPMSVSYASLFGTIISSFWIFYMSRFIEKRADYEAFQVCSKLAQEEAILFFQEIQEQNLQQRRAHWAYRILFNRDGDARFDIFHPGLKERIHYLKKFQEDNNHIK